MYVAMDLWQRNGCEPTRSNVEFLIYLHEADFKKGGKRKIATLDAGAQAAIESVQPFNHDGQSDELWVLHRLDITDKHHVINLSGFALVDTAWQGLEGIDGVEVIRSEVFPGPFKDGPLLVEALIRLPEGADGGEVEVHQNLPAKVAFDKSEVADGLLVVETLREILNYVRAEVLPLLEPFGEAP
jgi:hypothetical protein